MYVNSGITIKDKFDYISQFSNRSFEPTKASRFDGTQPVFYLTLQVRTTQKKGVEQFILHFE